MYGFASMQRLYRRPWIGVVAGGMSGAVVGFVVGALVGDVDTASSLGLIFAAVGTYPGLVAREVCIMLRILCEENSPRYRLEAVGHLVVAAGMAVGALAGAWSSFAVAPFRLGPYLLLAPLVCVGALFGGLVSGLALKALKALARPDDVLLISWTDAVVPQAFAVFGAFLVGCLGWGAPSPALTVAFGALGAAGGVWGGLRVLVGSPL
jgi:hypothetical protein